MKAIVEKYVKTLCMLVALLLLSLEGKAENRYATNQATLETALKNAVAGDVVYISAGNYTNPPILHYIPPDQGGGTQDPTFYINAGVTIIGGYGGGQTTITGNGAVNLFTLRPGAGTTQISGITFNNSNPSGNTGYPDGRSTISRGGAILGRNGVNVVIDNCSFTASANAQNAGGGAIYVAGNSNLQISNSTFSNCSSNGGVGGALMIENSTAVMNNCKIHNSSSQYGGAFYVNGGTLTATDCNIYENAVTGGGRGGAGYLANNSTVTMNHCAITNNTSALGGAGFSLDNTNNKLTLNNCTLAGNSNNGGQYNGAGAIDGGQNSQVSIVGSVIVGNDNGGQGGNDYPPGTTIEESIVDTTIIINTDTSKCNPCVIGGIDQDSVVQIGDSGNITIVVPPEIIIIDEDGDTTKFVVTDPTDTATGPIIQDPEPITLTLYLTASDTVVCEGDATNFFLQISEAVGSATFKLYRIDNGTKIQLASTESSGTTVTFVFVPRAKAYDRYVGEVVQDGTTRGESNERIVAIIPKSTASKIGHSENVTNEGN